MRAVQDHRLVLWDIDQTLIHVDGVTQHVYDKAFQAVTGLPLTAPWSFNGRTELAAITEALRAHDVRPTPLLVRKFTEHLIDGMHERAQAIAASGRVLAGAAAVLAKVGVAPAVHQSVLTGNLYELAALKLRVFGLDPHVNLDIGAYGGDAHDRRDLPNFALERCARVLGHPVDPSGVVIIGDTVRDVAAAQAIGARAIAVATGPYSTQELQDAGADVVLPDLADTITVLSVIIP